MGTEIFDPLESGVSMPLTLRLLQATVKLTLHTTYSMMPTCKAWYNVALPFLYRFIFIENHEQVSRIRATLWASQKQAQALSNGAASLSSRVRHLMLSFHPSDPAWDQPTVSCHTPPSYARMPPHLVNEEMRTEPWLHFPQAHGAQPHTMHIDLREARVPHGGARLVRLLLVRYCPQLTTVHLALNHAVDLDNVPTLPRMLARLSHYVRLLYEEDGVADLLATTAVLAPPALGVLHFTNAELTRLLRQYMWSSSAWASSPFTGRGHGSRTIEGAICFKRRSVEVNGLERRIHLGSVT